MVNWVLPIWDSFINLSAKGDELPRVPTRLKIIA
jgi:hypothetical protein